MKIKNPETGEVIVIPQGMEDAVRDAIESGNDPMEAMQMKYGGIHINPANKGKFNATKKATGKTTEELTHSKNPLTRKRAVFAQNAKRFKHQDGGQAMQQQQPQGGGQEDQMQQLVQMAEQALAQGASPEKVAQMLIQQGVPEQVVQQVIQYAIQDLQQQQQAQGQNPQEEAQEQGQQQNPQEEQAEMRYGGYMQGGGKSGKLTPEEIKWLATSLRGDQDPDYLSHYPDNSLPGLDPNRVKYLQDDQKAQLREYMKGTDMITDVVQGFTPNIPFFNPKPSGGVLENKGMPSQQRFIQKGYGGMSMYDDGGMAMYGNGGGIDNPGFRALPAYVQQDIINNMRTGGKFLRKAENGIRDNRVSRRAAPLFPDGPVLENNNSFATNPSLGNRTNTPGSMASPIGTYSTDNQPFGAPTNIDNGMSSMGSSGVGGSSIGGSNIGNNVGSNNSNNVGGMGSGIFGMSNNTFGGIGSGNNMGSAPGGSMGSGASFWSGTGGGNNTPLYGPENQPAPFWGVSQTNGAATAAITPSGNTKLSSFDKYNKGLSNITGGNSYFGRGIQHLGQATFDFTKGGLEMAGANISNRNALGDEANNLRSAMRNDYKKVGKRPTDGNAIISKYGGRMMQDGGKPSLKNQILNTRLPATNRPTLNPNFNRSTSTTSPLSLQALGEQDYGVSLNKNGLNLSAGLNLEGKNPAFRAGVDYGKGNWSGSANYSTDNNNFGTQVGYNNNGFNAGAGYQRNNGNNSFNTNAGYSNNGFNVGAGYQRNNNNNSFNANVGYDGDSPVNFNANYAYDKDHSFDTNVGLNLGRFSGGLNYGYNQEGDRAHNFGANANLGLGKNLNVNADANFDSNKNYQVNAGLKYNFQDGGATYADKMKVSKNSPEADFIAEKGEYIVNNGIASKLETGGSHASGNDTAISLDKSSNPSYVLSDTPRLKQLQFGGKRVSPSKYAEMATVEALGKTPDQILKAYTAFTKRAGTEGKVFGDRISDATNQLLAQKYQKDLATVKQIADQAYHKQEQLKHAMGMDNDLDHAQEVNGMSMAKFGGMQDGVHMNYFNAPAVQYGGSPQLFSDPSGLGYNTTQMGYGGLHKMQLAGKAPPVYLSDPNDPRIRMYSDSLAQFNTTKPFINEINRQNKTGVYDGRKLAQLQANNMRTFSTNPLYDFRGNVIGNSPTSKLSKNTKNMYPTSNRTLNTSIHTPVPSTMTSDELTAAYRRGEFDPYTNTINIDQSWRVDSYKEPTNPYLYRPERDKEQEIDLPTMGNVGTNQQISQPIINIPTISAPRKDYVTITESQGRRNPATGAFEKQTYKIDKVTGKRISEPEFTKQNGGMYRMAGGGNALNTTRQQSQTDYEKQWNLKQNTGDIGVDKYADIQNKSKIGFGNAEQNLKSFSQWKGIYPGYDELMKEVNKPGGPGKDNPKVGNFQKWFNNNYIPQQVKKLNDERVAAGQPAYDATQLNQLKTDLINDFGFDDTTGQRVDSDFGAFTSSRTPLNFSFNRPPADKKEPPVVKGDEPVVPKLTIDKEEEEPYYDFPAINAFIPQPYGRNPIGLALAQPQTIRPAKLNIQPELNEYNRGMRGAFRGTQGNTSVDVAQQMQGLNNLYGAQNKLYGQKYNFDEQSRMGADQFNAQAIMNTDAGNLQRIGAQQDAIARREGILDTQRRTDFQAGIENVQKENAYGLSKEYIEDVFAPYINNKGKIDLTQVPRTTTSKDKEKTYTRAEYDKMIAAEKKAALSQRYGGSLKKIKLKLRK